MNSEPRVNIRFLGSGDAFGSGRRMNACIMVEHTAGRFLLDCGCTALVSMRGLDVDPNGITAVFLSHLHGDHFGGLPFFILNAQLVSNRRHPLVVAGPAGTAARLEAAMEVLFPGSSRVERAFPLEVIELTPGRTTEVGTVAVTPFEVLHPSGAPALALRVMVERKVIVYTGDTAWTDILIEASRGADLLIAEAYTFDRELKNHLSHATISSRKHELGASRIILTHLGPEMLERLDEAEFTVAEDGAEFHVG